MLLQLKLLPFLGFYAFLYPLFRLFAIKVYSLLIKERNLTMKVYFGSATETGKIGAKLVDMPIDHRIKGYILKVMSYYMIHVHIRR